MNKETIVKEVIEILSTSNYIDTSEDLYDGLKQINREITLNTVHDFLWALESSTVIDMDGKVSECIKKLKPLLTYMNNERYQEIIDEVYRNYADSHWIPSLDANEYGDPITDWLNEYGDPEIYKKVERELELREKEWFIHEIKTNPEFSEKWGLKIEEKELSEDESYDLCAARKSKMSAISEEDYIKYNIPNKLITVIYNNQTIEIYE